MKIDAKGVQELYMHVYYSGYLHKRLMQPCSPCYQLLAGNQILCPLSELG